MLKMMLICLHGLLVSLSALSAGVMGEDECAIGRYRPDPNNCRVFHHCDGKTVSQSCGNLMFNPRRQICDWPINVMQIRPECREEEKLGYGGINDISNTVPRRKAMRMLRILQTDYDSSNSYNDLENKATILRSSKPRGFTQKTSQSSRTTTLNGLPPNIEQAILAVNNHLEETDLVKPDPDSDVPLVRPASTFPLVEETTKMSTVNDQSRRGFLPTPKEVAKSSEFSTALSSAIRARIQSQLLSAFKTNPTSIENRPRKKLTINDFSIETAPASAPLLSQVPEQKTSFTASTTPQPTIVHHSFPSFAPATPSPLKPSETLPFPPASPTSAPAPAPATFFAPFNRPLNTVSPKPVLLPAPAPFVHQGTVRVQQTNLGPLFSIPTVKAADTPTALPVHIKIADDPLDNQEVSDELDDINNELENEVDNNISGLSLLNSRIKENLDEQELSKEIDSENTLIKPIRRKIIRKIRVDPNDNRERPGALRRKFIVGDQTKPGDHRLQLLNPNRRRPFGAGNGQRPYDGIIINEKENPIIIRESAPIAPSLAVSNSVDLEEPQESTNNLLAQIPTGLTLQQSIQNNLFSSNEENQSGQNRVRPQVSRLNEEREKQDVVRSENRRPGPTAFNNLDVRGGAPWPFGNENFWGANNNIVNDAQESKEEVVVVSTERSRFGYNRPLIAASSNDRSNGRRLLDDQYWRRDANGQFKVERTRENAVDENTIDSPDEQTTPKSEEEDLEDGKWERRVSSSSSVSSSVRVVSSSDYKGKV